MLGGAIVLALIGLAWIRRIMDPGPLSRGDARWRYRDRALLERIDEALTPPAPPSGGAGRTRGWWLTRIEFGIAIALIVVVPLVLVLQPHIDGRWAGAGPWVLVPLGGYAAMLFGLAWMIRIYRAGLRNDAEATWRYRDRQS